MRELGSYHYSEYFSEKMEMRVASMTDEEFAVYEATLEQSSRFILKVLAIFSVIVEAFVLINGGI